MTPQKSTHHFRLFRENWYLKLISLVIAIFLWYFVVGEEKVEMSVTVPVGIVNLPHNLIISNQFKKQLEVTVSGSRGIIRNLAAQDITRTIDLAKANPGTMVIRNEPDSVRFPSGIKVQRIQPPYIILLLDELVKKDLAIKPIVIGTPAEGYEIAAIEPAPPQLELSGPKSILNSQTFLHTVPIDVTGISQPEVRQVSLELHQTLAELIGEPAITVTLQVQEKRVVKVVSKVPISLKGEKIEEYHYTLRPATVTIEAEFPYSVIKGGEHLREIFKVEAAAIDLEPGMHEVQVGSLAQAAGVRILNVAPETITIDISKSLQPYRQKLRKGQTESGPAVEPTQKREADDEKVIRN